MTMSDEERKEKVKEESEEDDIKPAIKPVKNEIRDEQDVKPNQNAIREPEEVKPLKEETPAKGKGKDEEAAPINDDEEDEEEERPRPKKRKVAAPDPDYNDDHDDDEGGDLVNEHGEKYVALSNKRRATVREFKGSTLIDLREYYTDKAGDEKPGSKGMSLTTEQWLRLKAAIPQIDAWIVAGSGTKNGDSSKNKSTRGKRKASGRS